MQITKKKMTAPIVTHGSLRKDADLHLESYYFKLRLMAPHEHRHRQKAHHPAALSALL